MNKYRKYVYLATICVAVFIVSASLCILVRTSAVYDLALDKSNAVQTGAATMSDFEMKLSYEQLADDFSGFFTRSYEVSGYEVSSTNSERLNMLKSYYRCAYILVVLSLVFGIYSFVVLARCRLYKPFLYGSFGAVILVLLQTSWLLISDNAVPSGIRQMIIKEDYSFFSDGDIVRQLLYPCYARYLFMAYLGIVFLLIIMMVLIRAIIMFHGRPHRF